MSAFNVHRNGTEIIPLPKSCERKKTFEDEGHAWRWLIGFRRLVAPRPVSLQPYSCPHCSLWHVGNPPGTKRIPFFDHEVVS